MRIAHVITRLIVGGAQENTVLTCEDLARDYGDEVLLVTGPPLGPEGSLLDRAAAGPERLAVLPELRRPIHPWRDWRSFRHILRVLRDFKPDVVHTHSAKAGVLGRAAAWRLKVPAVVHTVHGAPFHRYQGALSRAVFRSCERWAARRCHALIGVADAMAELIVEAGVAPREKLTTIYSGMEVEPYLECARHRERMRAELGYTPEHVVIGKIARLFHLKGHPYLIRAAVRAVEKNPNLRFLLVGDGILRGRLKAQIATAGLQEHFRFVGLVAPERIPEFLAALDVLVHVSLREGLARSLVQALIAGKPVVSYDIDGAAEVVISGQTGYLLPPESVDELAEALVRLAGDAELRGRFGAEGRRRFTDPFRHDRMTASIRRVYQRVLSGGELRH